LEDSKFKAIATSKQMSETNVKDNFLKAQIEERQLFAGYKGTCAQLNLRPITDRLLDLGGSK